MSDIILGKAYGKTVKITVNPTNSNAADITLQVDAGSTHTTNITSQGGGGSSTWGTITGTLSDQTDLQSALAAKASASSVALKAPIASPTFTGTVTGTFSGNITGNVTGNTSGSSGSCTGNSVTSTTASACSGNAATVTTNANLTGDCTSSGNATTVVKINGTTLSGLGTGILKNTTATGVPSIAVAGDFPTLNQNTSGSAATLTTPRAINGTNFDGSAAITVTAAAGTLTGTTLNATIVTSSLTSVGTIAAGVWSGTAVAIAKGGTGVAAVTTAPAATVWAGWDANKNLKANNHLPSFTTIATAAGTTVLVVGSTFFQAFTGATTQTVTLPVATTLANGQGFYITNASSGVVTVQTSGTNAIKAMAANSTLQVWVINTAGGTGTASWNWSYGAGLLNN